MSATAADLKAQYDLLKSIRDRLSETHATVLKIRDVRQQVEEIGARAERLGKGDALAKQAAALAGQLTAVEEKLTNPRSSPTRTTSTTSRSSTTTGSTWRPSSRARTRSRRRRPSQYYGLLKGRLDAVQAEYRAILDTDVKDFNRAVAEAKIPPVAPAPKIER